MEDTTYLNNQVSQIIGITKRQVLSWTEKGLINPFEESTGVGTKRGYNYVNLLEFGLCKKLFSMGLGFRAVKKMVNELYEIGVVRAWAKDLFGWFDKASELNKYLDDHEEIRNPKTQEELDRLDLIHKNLLHDEPRKQDRPCAVLAYFFGNNGESGYEAQIFPWKFERVLMCDEIKKGFSNCGTLLFVDIGKIKEEIDQRI